jgi:flagellar basal body-associated protein FliL
MLLLVLGAADAGGMRVVLLALLIVAILLIVAGAGIAVYTFYNARKRQSGAPHLSHRMD